MDNQLRTQKTDFESKELGDKTWQKCMSYGSERFSSATANNHNIIIFGDGSQIQKMVLGNDVALIIPQDVEELDIYAPYPTHQEAWLPMWFVLLNHSQPKSPEEREYREQVRQNVSEQDREMVSKALVHKAHDFWYQYQANDNQDVSPRKKFKQLTRILQDILLYVDAPQDKTIDDQDSYLRNHVLYPYIEHANALRKGERLETATQLERNVEDILREYSAAWGGHEQSEAAYEALLAQLSTSEAEESVILMPDETIESALDVSRLVRFDLLIASDEHDLDVISINHDTDEATFHQVDTKFGPNLQQSRRMDVIEIPPTLQPWDTVKKGKESYQPIGMMIATHTKAQTKEGAKVIHQMQEAFAPDQIARHYLGAAEEFLHKSAWGKSFRERIDKPGLSQVKKVIPLYRVACDLLPRAIFMLRHKTYPAGIESEELWSETGLLEEAHMIQKMLFEKNATQDELHALYTSIQQKFGVEFKAEYYQEFLENMEKMGSSLEK